MISHMAQHSPRRSLPWLQNQLHWHFSGTLKISHDGAGVDIGRPDCLACPYLSHSISLAGVAGWAPLRRNHGIDDLHST